MVDPYVLSVLILCLYFAYAGQAWNIMMGFAGQLSLGHSLYVGLGAYAAAALFVHFGVNPWVGAFAAIVICTVAGLVIGFLAFRFGIGGVYFAILTIAFAEFTRIGFDHWTWLGGSGGFFLWDHCFHALALAGSHPHLAWYQMMTLFDQQDESGALPDLINDRLISWSFCKPPVHGWILNRMLRDTTLLTAERLNEIYEPLSRWTNWWLVHRDDDDDGIPQCNHGNDGGWDNSTVLAVPPPIESPEISAYLVLQMEFLARAAQQLGRVEESTQWLTHAAKLTKNLLTHFWRNDHFIALQVNGHVEIEAQSLLLYMSLLLGKRLPQNVCPAATG